MNIFKEYGAFKELHSILKRSEEFAFFVMFAHFQNILMGDLQMYCGSF